MKKWISFIALVFYQFHPNHGVRWAYGAILAQAETAEPLPSVIPIGGGGHEITYSSAKQLLEKRKWPEAISILRTLFKSEPISVPVITSLAMALTYAGNREEALAILNRGAQTIQGDRRKYLIRRIRVLSCLFLTNKTFQIYQDGLNLMMGKKYRAAKERFEKAIVDEPDNVEILTRLGQSFVMDSDPGAAVRNFQFAFKLNEFQPEVRLWLGRALLQQNKFNEAIRELTAANNALHGSELAPLWLAEGLSQGGQVNLAIRLLDNDAKQWPVHVLSLLSLSKLRSQAFHADPQSLWLARKDLQLALSRLDQYAASDLGRYSGDLVIDTSKPVSEIKSEIQRLLQLIDNRISQTSDQR